MLAFPAMLIPLAQHFNMSIANTLEISLWMYMLFGISALPWGIFADRWGAKPLMLLFYAGAAVSGIAAAFCIDSLTKFTVALASLGFFSGIYHPTGLGLISKEIKRVSFAMGYNGMFGNLGLATAPLLTGIVNWIWGPKTAYLLLGAMNMLGLTLMLCFPMSKSLSLKIKKSSSDKKSKIVPAFFILLVVMMLGGIVYRGATVTLPSYLELKNHETFHWFLSLIGAGFSKNLMANCITSLIFLVGMIGQYTGGRAAERFNPAICYFVFYAITIPTAFLMGVVSNWTLTALAFVYFFFLIAVQPSENTLIARFTPDQFRHSAYGAKFVLTFGVGSLAVKIVSATQATHGIETVFPVLGLISIGLTGVIALLIRNMR